MELAGSVSVNGSSMVPAFENDTSVQHYDEYSPPFGEDVYNLLETIFTIVITGAISFFGIATNIINLLVFFRIGLLSDSNNVSLTGLAVSDLISCVLLFWGSISLCIHFYFENLDYRWDVWTFYLYSSFFPRMIFGQITCLLTTYIALERFVAITFPFKVKYIFTAKHTLYAVCCIFIVAFIIDFPQYTIFFPKWVFYPDRNTTVLKYVKTGIPVGYGVTRVIHTIFTVVRLSSFTIVVLCNIAMVWKLSTRKFRRSSSFKTPSTISQTTLDNTINSTTPTSPTTLDNTTSNTSTTCLTTIDNTTSKTSTTSSTLTGAEAKNSVAATTAIPSNRAVSGKKKSSRDLEAKNKIDKDRRLVAMMTTICALFILCYLPDIFITVIFFVLEMKAHWILRNTIYIFSTMLENINSSCNIFIYYSMSSRYRQHFLLLRGKKE